MNTHDVSQLSDLAQIAAELSHQVKPGDLLFLMGDLGMGKTTFTQKFIQSVGIKEHVKSPTYTLFESYSKGSQTYIHMDLYRLGDPEELLYLGIEDLLDGKNIILVEWPEKGHGILPSPQWRLQFSGNMNNRTLTITSQ